MTVSDATQSARERCVVFHPEHRGADASPHRTAELRLAEINGLAQAIDLDILHSEIVAVGKIRPSTYFGSGTVDRINETLQTYTDESACPSVLLVIVNCALSPIQQRNLERVWSCKVIDRTGLILEIFGERAATAEGELQVELAALSYQRSRLVRSWTHLERQRGGFGFLGGPGETQIEADRRLIGQRIAKLKKELLDVRRTRRLHRESRKRTPFPIIALVGYTNSGKSTLFNLLTHSDAVARDQLFATLDPKMRMLDLPSGQRVILSDTVGFISDLPHELVEAFRATLEEVSEADILLHVRDASHPEAEAQSRDVYAVLEGLGIRPEDGAPIVEVFNKIDLLTETEREVLANRLARGNDKEVMLSAVTGEHCDTLRAALDAQISASWLTLECAVPPADGATIAWLYRHGDVVERTDQAEEVRLKIRLAPAEAKRLAERMRQDKFAKLI
ncbi:MAG: GTPase HflX [Hyphomicrobiales bacterium]|nr:GTPase HflX [Hyphomicrobiales bacterium]